MRGWFRRRRRQDIPSELTGLEMGRLAEMVSELPPRAVLPDNPLEDLRRFMAELQEQQRKRDRTYLLTAPGDVEIVRAAVRRIDPLMEPCVKPHPSISPGRVLMFEAKELESPQWDWMPKLVPTRNSSAMTPPDYLPPSAS